VLTFFAITFSFCFSFFFHWSIQPVTATNSLSHYPPTILCDVTNVGALRYTFCSQIAQGSLANIRKGWSRVPRRMPIHIHPPYPPKQRSSNRRSQNHRKHETRYEQGRNHKPPEELHTLKQVSVAFLAEKQPLPRPVPAVETERAQNRHQPNDQAKVHVHRWEAHLQAQGSGEVSGSAPVHIVAPQAFRVELFSGSGLSVAIFSVLQPFDPRLSRR